ncbi:MAG: PA14 domain-containing protein, partial [Planctomycetaceae bacterium]
QTDSIPTLGQILAEQPAGELQRARAKLETLAAQGKSAVTRQWAYAAWMAGDRSPDAALLAASASKAALRDWLEAVPAVKDAELLGRLYAAVRGLVFELPGNLPAEPAGDAPLQAGIQVDYFEPNPPNVAVETLEKLQPAASGVVPEIVMDVPQLKRRDAFALRFTGLLQVPETGKYTFYLASDDGSRMYVDNRLAINNDRLQGMTEATVTLDLVAGGHVLVVTYFDNGGGDGLAVQWSGPGFGKQKIPADRLTVSGTAETLHDVAIRALGTLPGHEAEKFRDLAALVKGGRSRAAAIGVLKGIAAEHYAAKEVPGLVDNVVAYLSAIPARFRTAGPAVEAVTLAKSLAATLPAEASQAIAARLENLDVPVIAIGTVVERMIFDKEKIVVQAGRPVEFRFLNTDNMPHNLAIVAPGSLEEVGQLAEAQARDPNAKDHDYIPKSGKVLFASRLLEPGKSQALTYEAPQKPGVYPYVCTYPGHWRRMFGAL